MRDNDNVLKMPKVGTSYASLMFLKLCWVLRIVRDARVSGSTAGDLVERWSGACSVFLKRSRFDKTDHGEGFSTEIELLGK
jgi:hypothetical protein